MTENTTVGLVRTLAVPGYLPEYYENNYCRFSVHTRGVRGYLPEYDKR